MLDYDRRILTSVVTETEGAISTIRISWKRLDGAGEGDETFHFLGPDQSAAFARASQYWTDLVRGGGVMPDAFGREGPAPL